MYLSSGRGRKSGGACATGATPSLAPLYIKVQLFRNILTSNRISEMLKKKLFMIRVRPGSN